MSKDYAWRTRDGQVVVAFNGNNAIDMWRISRTTKEILRVKGEMYDGLVETKHDDFVVRIPISVCYSSRRAALVAAIEQEDDREIDP